MLLYTEAIRRLSVSLFLETIFDRFSELFRTHTHTKKQQHKHTVVVLKRAFFADYFH